MDIVGKLIERGAQLDSQTLSGKTALHIAVLKRLNECSSLLIKSGCSVNIQVYTFFQYHFYFIFKIFVFNQDLQGETPLHFALYQKGDRTWEMIRILVSSGRIDWTLRNKKKYAALQLAVAWNVYQ